MPFRFESFNENGALGKNTSIVALMLTTEVWIANIHEEEQMAAVGAGRAVAWEGYTRARQAPVTTSTRGLAASSHAASLQDSGAIL